MAVCAKRVIDTFDFTTDMQNLKHVTLPTEIIEYVSWAVGFGFGLGELQAKRELFSVKRKVQNEVSASCAG